MTYLADELLLDDLEELVLLESLTRDVERQVIRVNDTADELEVLGEEIIELVRDEHAADIQLEVLSVLAILLVQVLGGLGRNEQDGSENDLTLNGEVASGQWVLVRRRVFW